MGRFGERKENSEMELKQNFQENNLTGNGLVLAYGSRWGVKVALAPGSWSHCVTLRKEKGKNTSWEPVLFIYISILFRPATPAKEVAHLIVKMDLAKSFHIVKITPHRCAEDRLQEDSRLHQNDSSNRQH